MQAVETGMRDTWRREGWRELMDPEWFSANVWVNPLAGVTQDPPRGRGGTAILPFSWSFGTTFIFPHYLLYFCAEY